MIYVIYNLLLIVATPLIVAYHLYRSVSRRRPAALAERFGFVPREKFASLAGTEVIWVHAVSVGETIAAKPLLKALKQKYPHMKIVLSNMTETGRGVAENLSEVDLCLYFPFDYVFAADRLMEKIRPAIIIIVETELWPNFLLVAGRRGIPTIMVNGRISDRSFGRYLRLKSIFRTVLAPLSALCMQTPEDARRIVAIGADPAKVHVTKNLKYDIPVVPISADQKETRRKAFSLPATLPVVTAGSTHAGEEELLLAAYQTLLAEGRALFLVLVPRHPERIAQVSELLSRERIPFTLRSRLSTRTTLFNSGEVLLVDTIGELMGFYSLSELVFVGGSLVPTGGHNILEPASVRVPVLFGPHMSNFREISELMLACGGGMQVRDPDELAAAVRLLLDEPLRRNDLAAKGAGLLEANSGSTERHMAIIGTFLETGDARMSGRSSWIS